MNIKPINTKSAHRLALKRVEKLWDAKPKTEEGDELDILVTLINAYEEINFPIDRAHPIEVIKFRMEQLGLRDSDLTQYIGARSKVSEVLNLKRSLSLSMIRKLSEGLKIPVENLVCEYKLSVNNS
jgi:HTH-type transcriptional regulator/antitoxin HigA